MTNRYVHKLIRDYSAKGIIVDSNLLLLLLIGFMGMEQIGRFKRTQTFTTSDFRLLADFVRQFRVKITTPQVLTEVSNFSNALSGRSKHAFHRVLTTYVSSAIERHQASNLVVPTSSCREFGLTDAVLLAEGVGNYLLLTDDFRLSQFFDRSGGHSLNFNHLKTLKFGL